MGRGRARGAGARATGEDRGPGCGRTASAEERSRTLRPGLSLFVSTRQTDCQVRAPVGPPITGRVACGGTVAGSTGRGHALGCRGGAASGRRRAAGRGARPAGRRRCPRRSRDGHPAVACGTKTLSRPSRPLAAWAQEVGAGGGEIVGPSPREPVVMSTVRVVNVSAMVPSCRTGPPNQGPPFLARRTEALGARRWWRKCEPPGRTDRGVPRAVVTE